MGVSKYLAGMHPGISLHPLEPANSPTLRTGHKVGQHRIQGRLLLLGVEIIADQIRDRHDDHARYLRRSCVVERHALLHIRCRLQAKQRRAIPDLEHLPQVGHAGGDVCRGRVQSRVGEERLHHRPLRLIL